jgi:hypothetical protein
MYTIHMAWYMYIPSFVKTVSGIQVTLRSLPGQFESCSVGATGKDFLSR